MLNRTRSFVVAALAAAPLGACAHGAPAPAQPPLAYAPTPPVPAPILSELPADAPPGDCYARIRLPGEPAAPPPPVAQGAHWVQNPGPPGSPGPIWCLVASGPEPAPPPPAPVRFGWIRVLCDTEATPERIGRVQERLRAEGDYRGAVHGRYDRETAEAVGRFQHRRHIDHGGYLSRETVEALDAGAGYSGGYAWSSSSAATWGDRVQGYPPAPGHAGQAYTGQIYAGPTYGGPTYGGQAYAGQAYGAQSYAGSYGYAYGASGYGYDFGHQGAYAPGGYAGSWWGGPLQAPTRPRPAYAAPRSAVQDGWLVWQGKSQF